MLGDEHEIRELVRRWLEANRAGDLATVLGLMTEDVVFLQPGREPMGKAEFEAASKVPPGSPRPKVEGSAEIQEIQVSGELAFLWCKLAITVTPPGGSEPIERAGYTLTVLRKERGMWLLARDANLLTPVKRESK